MTDRIADPWGARTPYGPGESWPARVDVALADGVDEDAVERWVQIEGEAGVLEQL